MTLDKLLAAMVLDKTQLWWIMNHSKILLVVAFRVVLRKELNGFLIVIKRHLERDTIK